MLDKTLQRINKNTMSEATITMPIREYEALKKENEIAQTILETKTSFYIEDYISHFGEKRNRICILTEPEAIKILTEKILYLQKELREERIRKTSSSSFFKF